MTRYLYDRFSPGLVPLPRLIPLRRLRGPRLIRLGEGLTGLDEGFTGLGEGFTGFGADESINAATSAETTDQAPTFVWPIQPPPRTTPGQAFAAKLPSGKPHNAQDMGKGGDPVGAAAAGTVAVSTASGDARGNIIHVDHGSGWSTRYYHLDQRLVSRGDVVTQGQQIGVAGRTGLPGNNPHLHFMVYWGKTPVDPLVVLPPREGEVAAIPAADPSDPGWFQEMINVVVADNDPGTDVAGMGGMGSVLAAAGLAWLFLR